MKLVDIAGLVGVALVLVAYAAAALGKIDASRQVALAFNLVGALLILASLAYSFNVASFVMEGSWALVAAIGLVRNALKRKV